MTDRSKLGVSRRELLQTAAALGVGISVGSLRGGRAFAEPKTGGSLRIGLAGGATTDSFDPSTFTDSFMIMLGYAVRGNLVEVAADGSAKPEIAESFEPGEGAKKWRFKLRKGIAFSNGKPLTIDDVVSSINFHRGTDTKSPAKAILESVTEIKADGDSVEFSLKDANA